VSDGEDDVSDADGLEAMKREVLYRSTMHKLCSQMPGSAGTLVGNTFSAMLGQPWFPCRALCRSWASAIPPPVLGVSALRIKPAAYFDDAAPLAIARAISKLASVREVHLSMRGGCIQRLRTLQTAHRVKTELDRIQSERDTSLGFILDHFFGFLDCDTERTEIELLEAIRRASVPIGLASGLEIHPGKARRLFVSDLFERSFWSVGCEILDFEFAGGIEILSMKLRNTSDKSYHVAHLSYEVVSALDGLSAELQQSYGSSLPAHVHLPSIEKRLGIVHVSHEISLAVELPSFGDVDLDEVSIQIQPFHTSSEHDDRRSLFQRVQIYGRSMEHTPDTNIVLASTGWLHVAGPDGSEGATIVTEGATYGNEDYWEHRLGRIQELGQRTLGTSDFGIGESYLTNNDWCTRICHLVQFRTHQDGDQFRSIAHVHLMSDKKRLDLFALGLPSATRNMAREAAAEAAIAVFEQGHPGVPQDALCSAFPRVSGPDSDLEDGP